MLAKSGSIGQTVVVAGGAGFLGSHLCETLLAQGCDVICVDSFLTGSRRNIAHLLADPRFRLIEHDICEPLMLPQGVHRIYNLACPASPPRYQADPVHTLRTCVLGTLNLLDLAERAGARLLQASTSEVYGDPERHPQSEDYRGHVSCTGPRACYDEGKRAAETLCFDFLRERRADVRVARIFNTYGPRMQADDGRIISNLIVQALGDQPLTVYGDGNQTRSFCYVTDLIRGLMTLMEISDNPSSAINIGNPGEFTINELAQLVLQATGSHSSIEFRALPTDDPLRRRPDIGKAKSILGWEPTITLQQGLMKTIAYFQDDIAALTIPVPGRAAVAVAGVAAMEPER